MTVKISMVGWGMGGVWAGGSRLWRGSGGVVICDHVTSCNTISSKCIPCSDSIVYALCLTTKFLVNHCKWFITKNALMPALTVKPAFAVMLKKSVDL